MVMKRRMTACVVGFDLAASPQRPTGLCVLRGRRVEVGHLLSDTDILRAVRSAAPTLVAIDAPPPRCQPGAVACLTRAHVRKRYIFEPAISSCVAGAFRFPLNAGVQRQLTLRGIYLTSALTAEGCTIIETYPGAAQDLWGIPRQRDRAGLQRGLMRFQLQGLDEAEPSPHVLGAVTCALVGQFYLAGNAWSIGHPEEALMLLPPPNAHRQPRDPEGCSERPPRKEKRHATTDR